MSTHGGEKKVRTIRQEVQIPAKPEEVYEAIIDGGKHTKFTGSKATSDPKVGGKFTAWDGYIMGRNLELVKGKRIVQEWKTTEWPENYPPSRLELTFKEKDGATELTMVHSGVPSDQADDIAQGWIDFYWEPLKEYFNSG